MTRCWLEFGGKYCWHIEYNRNQVLVDLINYGDVDLSYLELAGNYYAMFWIDTGEGGWDNTCFVIKDKSEWLVWKRGHGVYQLQRIDKTEEKVHAYWCHGRIGQYHGL